VVLEFGYIRFEGKGSPIRGTNGESSGLLPLLKVLNEFAKHVNQGGKRKGSVAIYLEPWHKDILKVLEMKKNHGDEELRARDLFYALWNPDIFMRRVKRAIVMKRVTGAHDIKWSLMCPDKCQGLSDCYGSEFDELYERYEAEGLYDQQIDILVLWQTILDSQKETGGPYMCYKDSVNSKSNQKNIGMINSSNLCTEIMQVSNHEETAVCNLASINLKKMIKWDSEGNPYFDFQLLHDIAKIVNRNLNRIIDINYYPIPQAKRSNFRHRPVGDGVQGEADAFILMGYPYESLEAQQLNRDIFETIYHGSLEASNEQAYERYQLLSQLSQLELDTLRESSSEIDFYDTYLKDMDLQNRKCLTIAEQKFSDKARSELVRLNIVANEIIHKYNLPTQIAEYQYITVGEKSQYLGAYSTFVGSPAHQGQLQYDLWGVQPSGRWDFDRLKTSIDNYGLRNSLVATVMPTATTAQILGNIECVEPLTSNLYTRQVLSGSFIVVNRYLQEMLTKLDLWSTSMKEQIVLNNGSIQNIEKIPLHIRELFKLGSEMSKKTLINMSAARGAFIDQSQSYNIFVSDPTDDVLTSIHLYGWEQGLKTGMYYLRRSTLVDPKKFSIDFSKYQEYWDRLKTNSNDNENLVCDRNNKDCLMCSS
jgi:ribonucleotide reductase alpha subunit